MAVANGAYRNSGTLHPGTSIIVYPAMAERSNQLHI